MKKYNHLVGNHGENIAENYLLNEKYIIKERNFRCKLGEVDIIAKQNNCIIFVEIKSRCDLRYGYPVEAITYLKKKKIINIAKYYLQLKSLYDYYIRFDIIEIYFNEDLCKFEINHLEDAFRCD